MQKNDTRKMKKEETPAATSTVPKVGFDTRHGDFHSSQTGGDFALSDDSSYDEAYFQSWLDKLKASLQDELPALLTRNTDTFVSSCQAVQSAGKARKDAQDLRDQLAEQNPVNQEALEKANKALTATNQALQASFMTCMDIAGDVLEDDGLKELVSESFEDKNLLTFVILKKAGPKNLANWCQLGDSQTKLLLNLLGNTNLQRIFLQGGGARNGKYGRCMEIYSRIHPTEKDPVLQRLALAVALELCDPPVLFGYKDKYVDPFLRYVHYEQSYLWGELDLAFSHFTVWEMRMIVNSDAPDEQLGWGRQCLMNYRPDLVLMDDPQWRYCRIVRTDVSYNQPDFYKNPRTYDQVLSGGGECGPRAWYGRFICKAFGIPTWGIRQPGHAAMTRWTSKGCWMVCLGREIEYSWWEGRGGLDFFLETEARGALKDDEVYMREVMRLEWVALFHDESHGTILSDCLPDPANLWYALSLLQRKRLASDTLRKSAHSVKQVASQFSSLTDVDEQLKSTAVSFTDESIIIPATACSNPTNNTDKVYFLPSFLGGRQLFIGLDASVEYTLPDDLFVDTPKKYMMTCRVCTVHRKEKPLLLTVTSNEACSQDQEVQVKIPYTMGMWEITEPVSIEIGGSSVTNTKLVFKRQEDQLFGISLKDIKLVLEN